MLTVGARVAQVGPFQVIPTVATPVLTPWLVIVMPLVASLKLWPAAMPR
jgi:hypothetical protein